MSSILRRLRLRLMLRPTARATKISTVATANSPRLRWRSNQTDISHEMPSRHAAMPAATNAMYGKERNMDDETRVIPEM